MPENISLVPCFLFFPLSFLLFFLSFFSCCFAFAVLIRGVLQKKKPQKSSVCWHHAWKRDILHIYFSYIFKNIHGMVFVHELPCVFGRAASLPSSWATTQGHSSFSSCWSFPQKETPSEKHPLLRAALDYSSNCQQVLEKKAVGMCYFIIEQGLICSKKQVEISGHGSNHRQSHQAVHSMDSEFLIWELSYLMLIPNLPWMIRNHSSASVKKDSSQTIAASTLYPPNKRFLNKWSKIRLDLNMN